MPLLLALAEELGRRQWKAIHPEMALHRKVQIGESMSLQGALPIVLKKVWVMGYLDLRRRREMHGFSK